MHLDGKVSVITGGASGIGAACARAFAARGAKVVVADLNAGGAEQVAAEVDGTAVPCDVGSEAEIGALVRAAEDAYGPIIAETQGDGLLEWDNPSSSGRALRLTPRGRLLGNEVFVRFFVNVVIDPRVFEPRFSPNRPSESGPDT